MADALQSGLRAFLKDEQQRLNAMLIKIEADTELTNKTKQALSHIIAVQAGVLLSVEVELDRLTS